MSWAKLDDRWPRHPKAVTVGPLGRDLFVCGLCYCNEHLTDGFIPASILATLALPDPSGAKARNGATAAPAIARRLVAARLWDDVPGGWQVHDYHDWNASAEEVRAKRQAKRERMDRWRRGVSRGAARSASRGASVDAPVALAPSPTTDPTPLTPLSTTRVPSAGEARYDWPSPEVKANSLRSDGTRWLPGRFPFEAFRHDCPDRSWRGHCVNPAWVRDHPGTHYPTSDANGTPKQCPSHRAEREASSPRP